MSHFKNILLKPFKCKILKNYNIKIPDNFQDISVKLFLIP